MPITKILLELNQNCNLRCAYCFYNDLGRSSNRLTLGNIQEIYKKYPDIVEFFLTGGECCINPDFFAITKFLSEKGRVIVFSNGLVACNDKLFQGGRFFKFTDKVVVTCDSVSRKYSLRGSAQMKILEIVQKFVTTLPNKLEIKICVSNLNAVYFEDTLKTLINMGVVRFSINFIKNIKSNDINFQLERQSVLNILSIARKYEEYFSVEDLEFMEICYTSRFLNRVNCIAGKTFIFINSKNQEFLCPCTFKNFVPGQRVDCFGEHCICIWELFR